MSRQSGVTLLINLFHLLMKWRFLIITLTLIILYGFNSKHHERSNEKVVKKYYNAYNSKDYKKLKKLVSEEIKLLESGHQILDSRALFIQLVEWGEVFNAVNQITSIESVKDSVIINEIQESERIQFLHNCSMTAVSRFVINKRQIVRIEVDYPGYDFTPMYKKANQMLKWLTNNRPDLLETYFRFDKVGAETYLKAIEAYQEDIN